MVSLLLALFMLLAPQTRAGCAEVDMAVLDSHTGWAITAWRGGDEARFSEAHRLVLEDIACLAGTGLRTRNTDLFLVLASGAVRAGDDGRALAALRALLLIQGDYQPDPALLPLDQPLAPLFAMAQVLGPDAAGFKALYLGQDPTAAPVPPVPLATPTAEQLEAQRREEFLARVRAEVELDRKAHRAGVITATSGGIVCGVSLALILARNTSGESKEAVKDRAYREQMGKLWTGTAIAGGATMGAGLWLMVVSQLDAGGGVPVVGLGGRF
jgi:hypothetical protein